MSSKGACLSGKEYPVQGWASRVGIALTHLWMNGVSCVNQARLICGRMIRHMSTMQD